MSNQVWDFEVPSRLMKKLQWQVELMQVLLILFVSSYMTTVNVSHLILASLAAFAANALVLCTSQGEKGYTCAAILF